MVIAFSLQTGILIKYRSDCCWGVCYWSWVSRLSGWVNRWVGVRIFHNYSLTSQCHFSSMQTSKMKKVKKGDMWKRGSEVEAHFDSDLATIIKIGSLLSIKWLSKLLMGFLLNFKKRIDFGNPPLLYFMQIVSPDLFSNSNKLSSTFIQTNATQ